MQLGARMHEDAAPLAAVHVLADDPWVVAAANNGPSYGIKAFTGREWDPEIGLYYYRARYYDPKVGRFISEDPIRLRGGSTLYAYVENDPTTFIDPYGLFHCVQGANCNFTPDTQTALQCFDTCSHADSAVTSGLRPAPATGPGNSHSRGEACDLGRGANPNLAPATARTCFQQCFPQGYGQEEANQNGGTHFHFQLHTVPGGQPGYNPAVQPHQGP